MLNWCFLIIIKLKFLEWVTIIIAKAKVVVGAAAGVEAVKAVEEGIAVIVVNMIEEVTIVIGEVVNIEAAVAMVIVKVVVMIEIEEVVASMAITEAFMKGVTRGIEGLLLIF